jgi:putative hydrolase of HD superfamily
MVTIGSKGGISRFFARAGLLKKEPRRGWVLKFGMSNPESVADHSYRVALMTMVYADMRGLDSEKAVKMALLHDLPESLVGDSIPGERAPRAKKNLESGAMRRLLKDLPQEVAVKYLSTWDEFEDGKSEEAKLVRQLDKLEMAIQAYEYKADEPARDVDEFIRTARGALVDPELVAALDFLG